MATQTMTAEKFTTDLEDNIAFLSVSGNKINITKSSKSVSTSTANTAGTSTAQKPVVAVAVAQSAVAFGALISGESIGTGNGAQTAFGDTAASPPVKPGTIKIKHNGVQIGQDDGAGNVTGTNLTGTIVYSTGVLALTYSVAPAGGVVITWDYNNDNSSAEIGVTKTETESAYNVKNGGLYKLLRNLAKAPSKVMYFKHNKNKTSFSIAVIEKAKADALGL